MLTIGFQYIALMRFRYVPGTPEVSKTFNMKVLDFGKGFLSILWDDNAIFFFQFVNMLDYFDGFSYTEPSLHLWDEAYLIIVDDVFDVFLDSVCKYFIE